MFSDEGGELSTFECFYVGVDRKKGRGGGLFQQSAFSCTVNNEAQFKRDQWIILWWEISRVLLQMI